MLRDNEIKNAKPASRRYTLTDSDGLTVYVEPTGRKTFYYVYKTDGKKKQIKIGPYPAMSLREARDAHRELMTKRERGEIGVETLTFREVAEKYLSNHKKDYTDGGTEIERILEKDVYPFIGKVKINELKKSDIVPILQAIIDRKAQRQSNITKQKISVICRYACQIGQLEINPCDNLPEAKENDPRQVILTNEQIKDIYANKNNSEMDKVLCLMLLTGQRGGECKEIKFEEIDGDWWTCEQRKGGKVSHKRVYLTPSAKELIGNGEGQVFLLSSNTKPSTHVKRKGVNYTPHDIRRTVATKLAEVGFDDYLIHRFLGHSVDKLTRTYNVHRYDSALQEMAETLEEIILKIYKSV